MSPSGRRDVRDRDCEGAWGAIRLWGLGAMRLGMTQRRRQRLSWLRSSQIEGQVEPYCALLNLHVCHDHVQALANNDVVCEVGVLVASTNQALGQHGSRYARGQPDYDGIG
jgi:hypothetical protein